MRADYADIVRSGIDQRLQDDSSGGDNGARYRECVAFLAETIGTIRNALQTDPFRDTAEEIAFYKETAPRIWGQYLFYAALVKIEARRFLPKETFVAELRRRLKMVEGFFENNDKICEYYHAGRTRSDKRLFTRNGARRGALKYDPDLALGTCGLLRMRKNELLRDWLTEELEPKATVDSPKIPEWKASAIQTIELFKALHLEGCFGEVPFDKIMKWAKEALGVETKNHSVNLQHMRDRKGSVTQYLDDLRTTLKKAMGDKL